MCDRVTGPADQSANFLVSDEFFKLTWCWYKVDYNCNKLSLIIRLDRQIRMCGITSIHWLLLGEWSRNILLFIVYCEMVELWTSISLRVSLLWVMDVGRDLGPGHAHIWRWTECEETGPDQATWTRPVQLHTLQSGLWTVGTNQHKH